MTKKLVADYRRILGEYDRDTLPQLVARLQEEIDQLSADQRETATFDIKSIFEDRWDDSPTIGMYVNFQRLETDFEEQKRVASEAEYAARQAVADKATYERLKKQFE